MHLADEVGGNLAGAETGHLHRRRNALDFLVQPPVDILGGDGQRVGPLEAFIFRLDGFHVSCFRILEESFSGPFGDEGGAGEGTRTPTSCDTWT